MKKRVRDLERAAGMTASGRGRRPRSHGPEAHHREATAGRRRRHGRTATPAAASTAGTSGRRRSRRQRRRHRDPSAARHRARAAGLGAQSRRGPGGGRAPAWCRSPGSPATKAATLVADDAPVALSGRRGGSSRAAGRSSMRRSTGSASTPRAATAWTPAPRPAGSPIACSRRAPRGWSPSTSGTASSRGRCAPTTAVTVMERTNVRDLAPADLPFVSGAGRRRSVVHLAADRAAGARRRLARRRRDVRPPGQAAVRGGPRRRRAAAASSATPRCGAGSSTRGRGGVRRRAASAPLGRHGLAAPRPGGQRRVPAPRSTRGRCRRPRRSRRGGRRGRGDAG